MKTILTALALGIAVIGFGASPARADLKFCNNTPGLVQVAVGYKDKEGWASEGWWTVKAGSCAALMKGSLIARYYYLYALDEKKLVVLGGKALMCTKDKIFTIRGLDKCTDRGFIQQGFGELDTGEKQDWTVNLAADKSAAATPPAGTPDAAKPQP